MRFSPFLRICSAVSLMTMGLGGCAFLVPEDPSAPRYNSVSGERHRPQMNSMTPQGSAAPIATTPIAQNGGDSRFPPVDQSVQAQANQQISSVGLPPPMSQDPALAGRHMPMENNLAPSGAGGDIAVSENNYPPLYNVPQRPPVSGDDSAAAHLGRVRSELERDRDNGNAVRDQLNRDAASEPSMLKKMLDNGPAWETLPTAVSPMENKTVPVPPAGRSMNLYNPNAYAYGGGASGPINLRPPAPSGPIPPSARIVQHAPAAMSMAPAASGGFNPMADTALTDGALAMGYAGDGYLPSSRYASQR